MLRGQLKTGDIVSYQDPYDSDGPFRGIAVGPSKFTTDWHVDFSAIGFNRAAQIPLADLTLVYPVGSNPFDLEDIS